MRSLGASRTVCCGWAITWPTTRRTWTTREISKQSARRSFLSLLRGRRGRMGLGVHPGPGKGIRLEGGGGEGSNRSNVGFGALRLDSLLQGPPKLTATGTGRTWATVKSRGSFYGIIFSFSLRESGWVVGGGVFSFFLFPPPLISS